MTDFFFRTDGNSAIATGHIMRCLTIARACAEKAVDMHLDIRIAFIVSDEESSSLLQERFAFPEEFPVICLHNDYRRPETEIPVLCSLSTPKKPWLFIDSYYVTPAYFNTLAPHFRVAYLDDLRAFTCPVDLIVNYDTDDNCSYYAAASKRLLGAQYTPLRRQFHLPFYEVRPEVKNVLFSTGGTDPYEINQQLLQAFSHSETLAKLHCHILTSRANPGYEALISLTRTDTRIHIHEKVFDMASLMAACDLAVSAGGTTLYELCAVGVPSISFLMAQNQKTAVDAFADRGLIPCAGDIRPVSSSGIPQDSSPAILPYGKTIPSHTVNETVLQNILTFMTDMSQNLTARQKSSQAMRAFLDGCGAERIASQLLQS